MRKRGIIVLLALLVCTTLLWAQTRRTKVVSATAQSQTRVQLVASGVQASSTDAGLKEYVELIQLVASQIGKPPGTLLMELKKRLGEPSNEGEGRQAENWFAVTRMWQGTGRVLRGKDALIVWTDLQTKLFHGGVLFMDYRGRMAAGQPVTRTDELWRTLAGDRRPRIRTSADRNDRTEKIWREGLTLIQSPKVPPLDFSSSVVMGRYELIIGSTSPIPAAIYGAKADASTGRATKEWRANPEFVRNWGSYPVNSMIALAPNSPTFYSMVKVLDFGEL